MCMTIYLYAKMQFDIRDMLSGSNSWASAMYMDGAGFISYWYALLSSNM